MKLAKVKFCAPAIESFFIENPEKSFGVTKGLPDDARLIGIRYSPGQNEGFAVFHSESFDDIKDGDEIPVKEVEYTAYRFMKEGDEPNP